MNKEEIISEIRKYPFKVKKYANVIDKELGLIIVGICGYCLELFPDHLKDDEDIVKLAVSKCGFNLSFASERLQDNKDLAELAMETDASYLKFASLRIREDDNMISKLYEKLKYSQLPKSLKRNEKIKAHYNTFGRD